jgi:UDP-GlcNAc:undecaprenyl-phosphate/decaprenyl-phosphate GlcNAc-1-phosphate transferase
MWSDRYPVAFAGAALIAFLLTPLAGRLAVRLGLVDEPGGHRVHTERTPTLGGLAVFTAIATMGTLAATLDDDIAAMIVAAGVLGLVGFVDDLRGVRPVWRLAIEAAVAVLIWAGGIGAGIGSAWVELLLTVFWVVAVVNAFNMIDNHDGVSSSLAALGALGVAAIAIAGSDIAHAMFALAFAGACLGFLWHNFPPAKVFLGDAGSMPLGFLLAALTMDVRLDTGSEIQRLAVAGLLVMAALCDQLLVVIARARDRRPLMGAATDHTSHRLRALGWSKRRVVVAFVVVQLPASILAVAVARATGRTFFLVTLLISVTAALVLVACLLRLPTSNAEAGERAS